jgi:hypothetical protein
MDTNEIKELTTEAEDAISKILSELCSKLNKNISGFDIDLEFSQRKVAWLTGKQIITGLDVKIKITL